MGAASGPLRVVLAQPRGFCAGVDRAISIVESALRLHGPPVYVRHEIVHNRHVVDRLRRLGAVFVDEVDEIPEGAITIFSAHGVARRVVADAEARGLDAIDATCPLVHKVHIEGRRYAAQGYDVVLIGHANHPEVEGTRGQIDGEVHVVGAPDEVERLIVRDPARVAYVTQTTLSVHDTRDVIAALERRFPGIVGPDTRDICYATQNRQNAVLALAREVQALLVVGSANSSNSSRLREIGAGAGCPSYLIEQPSMIEPAWLDGVDTVGLTAGASAPEALVQATVDHLGRTRPITVETLDGIVETARFRLPERLMRDGVLAS
jgi:4-hydroxy-3-methylbut-2-enyl diphosphate reductase